MLEKGPRHRPGEFPADEVTNYTGGFWVPDPEDEPHVVVPAGGRRPVRSDLGWIAVCLGGGTVHMGAYLYRFHPDDFRLRSRFGPYAEIADWPYSYDELEPYYTEAEWEIGIAGGAEPASAGIPRSRALPMPPLSSHPIASLLDRACDELGLHPYPTPRGVNSRPYGGRPACSYCQLCAGFGCRTGAKGSSQSTLIERAEVRGRCRIVTGTKVFEITVGADGRATGCRYLDAEDREREARARIVCVCCSAVESARLLLMSKSARFPDGLANGNGLVGRHLQFHAISQGTAHFRVEEFDPAIWRHPHPFFGRSLLDYYFLPAGVSDLAKGGLIRFNLPQSHAIAWAQRLAEPDGAVLWGDDLVRRLDECFVAMRAVDFEVFHDYVPNAATRIELDPEVVDRWGFPAARIHLGPDPHHARAGGWLQERGLAVLERMGAHELVPGARGETAPYLVLGTCRAGRDPATSVLDPWCRAHEVPNLFVVDGSFMPTSGGAAPTLTILANSFRTADHIVAEVRRGEWAAQPSR